MIPEEFTEEVFRLIADNESADPYELSLRMRRLPRDLSMLISNQVHARKKLQHKMPQWLKFPRIILPGPVAVEQASSSITAEYKAGLVAGKCVVDLTGGLGIDTFFLSRSVDKVIYVEKDPEIAAVASYNFSMMNLQNIEVVCSPAEQFLREYDQRVDWIYLDPSRRSGRDRVFHLKDAEPNILEIQEDLLSHARQVMVKASPFLDIHYAWREVKMVREVHVVAIDNECKEILLLMDTTSADRDIPLITVNRSGNTMQHYASSIDKENRSKCTTPGPGYKDKYLFDPNAAIRKAGLFRSICEDFKLLKMSANSHLYLSDGMVKDFPGRVFRITGQYNYHAFLKQKRLKKAHITVRNCPMTVKEIRNRTGIREGGDLYIFGTTGPDRNVIFLVCHKVS